MEKYGVEESVNDTKVATDDSPKCPDCGRNLTDPEITGGTLICASCGTKPFEKK